MAFILNLANKILVFHVFIFFFFRLSKHQKDIKIYQANEEELNKKIIKLKSKLKHMVRRSKQLNEENSIDNHVATLMNEMKVKEDAYEVEKNKLNTDNQCLKKKIVVMEKDIENLNSKVCAIIVYSYYFVCSQML